MIDIEKKKKDILNFKNWKKIAFGFFVYKLDPTLMYEILFKEYTDINAIDDARANLYFSGIYRREDDTIAFERVCVLSDQPVKELILAAANNLKDLYS